jgi:hypothetical protein
MDESIKPNAEIETKVNQMQNDLEVDPKFADRFVKIGQAAIELSNENIDRGESVLGNLVMDVLRRTVKANAAFSTASSFRAAIPPAAIRLHMLPLYSPTLLSLPDSGEEEGQGEGEG